MGKSVVISFWLKGKNLGTYPCVEFSSQDDRNKIAEDNGIMDYDAFILDGGRVIGFVVHGVLVTYLNL
jgi:hypothetical protein